MFFVKKLGLSIVTPPYKGLPWLLVFYIALSAFLLPHGGVFAGVLFGFDDQVRMTQVLNWVNGVGWYDRTIMRVNAPEGFTTIWSRIVDMPIAAVVILAQQFVSQKTAALVAAFIIPLIETALLFLAAPYFARPLLGKNKAQLINLFLLFTCLINIQYFSPSGFAIGQASHHPWYIILDLMMFGSAARLAMGSTNRSPVFILAASLALLTAVGIEGYPMMMGVVGLITLTAWWYQRPMLADRTANAFMLGTIGSLILLPLHQPPGNFFTISFTQPSILGVIALGAAAVFLKAEYGILGRWQKNKILAAIFLSLTALFITALLIVAFPDFLQGPGAGLSPSERKVALHDHTEAKAVHAVARTVAEFLNYIVPPLIALAAGIFAVVKTRGKRRRMIALFYLGFAGISIGMSEIYSRFYHHAMTTGCAWLTWLWEDLKSRLRKGNFYALSALGIFIILGPLWMLFIPAIAINAGFTTHILLFPAHLQADPDECDSLTMADYINAHYSKDTLLEVPYWYTAQFLYQTDIRIDYLNNFPSHDKFIDNYNFVGTKNAEEARQIAARHNIDLVVVCQYPFLFHGALADEAQIFMARLQAGRAPNWLKLVRTNLKSNYLLYEVDKTLAQKPEAP